MVILSLPSSVSNKNQKQGKVVNGDGELTSPEIKLD